MKRILTLIILSTLLLSSCGKEDEILDLIDDTAQSSEDLTENGISEGVDGVDESFVALNACDTFNDPRSGVGAFLQTVFPNFSLNCEALGDRKVESLLIAHSFIHDVMEKVDLDANNKCGKFLKRATRKFYQMYRRQGRIDRGAENSDLLALRNQMAKSRLDKIMRKLYKHGCTEELVKKLEVSVSDSEESLEYKLGNNHLINGSFELLKIPTDDIKGTSQLEDGWTILESSNVPGWKVTAVDNSDESKKCDYLEVQTSGLVADAPHGNQIIELDGHCTSENGRKTHGNSRIEITQKTPVATVGTYRVRLYAQKRSGRYGELEIATFQRKSEKSYTHYELPNQSQWTEICHEIEVTDTSKNVVISIRDNGDDGRQTFGLLVDDIVFEKASCDWPW